jgi:uncharacterized protein YdeI (YjbR/CyaY-like superfamily)
LSEQNKHTIIEKGEHIKGIPVELQILPDKDSQAKNFFETLSTSYRRGYCDRACSAKQEATRQIRAEKALIMLKKGQKTLKTYSIIIFNNL